MLPPGEMTEGERIMLECPECGSQEVETRLEYHPLLQCDLPVQVCEKCKLEWLDQEEVEEEIENHWGESMSMEELKKLPPEEKEAVLEVLKKNLNWIYMNALDTQKDLRMMVRDLGLYLKWYIEVQQEKGAQ